MKAIADQHKTWRVKKVLRSDVQLSKRWIVVHDHDGSPVDGCIFMHRKKADEFLSEQRHPEKFRVEHAALMSVQMADQLLFGNG